jgi:hypothetical protein
MPNDAGKGYQQWRSTSSTLHPLLFSRQSTKQAGPKQAKGAKTPRLEPQSGIRKHVYCFGVAWEQQQSKKVVNS